MIRKIHSGHVSYLVLLITISLLSVRGYLVGITSTLPTTGSDDWIITWILNQTISKIPNDLGNIFNGNIFYPYQNTMAYSIMMIPSAFVSYLPTIITGSFYTAFNFTVVFSQVTTAVILYFILYEVSESKRSSSIASLAFVLSNIRMSYGVHIHPYVLQYFLLGFFSFIKFKKTYKTKYLYLTFFLLGVQVWESLLQVVFIIVSIVLFVFFDLQLIRKYFKNFVLGAAMSIFVALPPMLSYMKVPIDFGRPRNIREVAHFASSLDQLKFVDWSIGLYALFFISALLIIFAKLKDNEYLKPFLLITFIGFIFSLGPVLKWNRETVKLGSLFIPLPYGILYYLFPPLWAIRSVSRYAILMATGMAGVINITLPAFNKKFLKLFYVPLILMTILGGVFINQNQDVPQPSEFKEVYKFIKDSDVNAIAEYPFFGVDNKHGEEMKRMVYSLYHGKALFNGASGFIPKQRADEISTISRTFPDADFIEILKANDIGYFVIHKEFIDSAIVRIIESQFAQMIEYEDEEALVVVLKKS